jgi:tripartite-type tricarboxylate transporter receptor subunit TctC
VRDINEVKQNMRIRRGLAAALAALLIGVLPAFSQDWPAKTVRIIVPFGPGSTPDLVARLIADQLQGKLGASFVVENKPGASGNIGTDAVAKAEPDGTTLGVSIAGPLAINTLLFSKLPYDPFRDIAPITVLATQPSVLAVPENLGISSVAELVDRLKREPGKYNYGSIGSGSVSQLAMEAIALKSGTQLVHIPYASSPQAVTALMRGDVQIVCLPAIAVVPQAKTGNIRMLAVTTAERFSLLPDIGTLREAGIEGVESSAWMGMIAPAGTPQPMIDKIARETIAALQVPAVSDKLKAQLMLPVGNTPAEFTAELKAELARWAPVIKAANIRIN